ncbi:MAG: response regulator [Spirochaetia bacterium]|jgi:two-component system response regulator YesN|nr:response regulator [Spirochaetia bacterium]
MKCIIADDERLVRYSIQDMLEEIADAGVAWFDAISQVVNGKDLLAQVRVVQPELVFVDIRMPLLSGLDAMEKGRELSPCTQWIILTGYAEFEYAKRAIALGALDYLLKPASRSDIERIVRLALSRLADRRIQEQMALEHRILGILQDIFSEDPESPSDTTYAGLLLTLDSPLLLKDTSVMQKQVQQNLRSWLRLKLPSSCIGGVAVLDDGNMICVVSAPSENELQDILPVVADYSLTTLVQD